MQGRVQSMATGNSLSRIQSLPKEASMSEAQSGPIYRSCSDTKAEQDKWQSPRKHESPKSAGWRVQIPAPASIHNPTEGHAPGSLPEYGSGKQASRAMHETKPQAGSVPDKARRLEGKAGETCHYVPSKAHTQGQLSKNSSGKQAGRAMNMASAQPNTISEHATRSEGKADVTCNCVPPSKNSSGQQAGRAVQVTTPQPRSQAKAARCEPDRMGSYEGRAELAGEVASDLADVAHWQMLGARLAPATYSFYSTQASAAAEDSSLCVVCSDPLCIHTSPLACLCHRILIPPLHRGCPNAAIPCVYGKTSCMFAAISCILQYHACMLPGAMSCHKIPSCCCISMHRTLQDQSHACCSTSITHYSIIGSSIASRKGQTATKCKSC